MAGPESGLGPLIIDHLEAHSMSKSTSNKAAPSSGTRRAGRPCVFLDRDGVVTREAGYLNHPDRLELLPGSAGAIRRLNERGILTVVTTNQSGIARGYFTEAVLAKTHRRLRKLLAERGARLDAIYHAPMHPQAKDPALRRDPDAMRKPGTGMIQLARKRFRIDMSRAWVVGDRTGDMELARNAGIGSVFVLSGYGLGEYEYHRREWAVQPDHICANLAEAARWIAGELRRRPQTKK